MPTLDTHQSSEFTKLLYLGDSGSGKTGSLVSLLKAGYKIKVLDLDNGVIFSGHIDRLVEFGGKTYVQDQKTTGTTITQRFFNQFNPDTQMSMYTFAGKALFGVPVAGVMIDGAQIAVGFTRFERGFSYLDSGSLNEWYDDAMYHVETARHATRENFFPKNTASCGNYGGCEFRHICSRGPSVREQFLKADFEKQPRWDPLESR